MLLERSFILVFVAIIAVLLINSVFGIYLGKDNYLTRLLEKISFSLDDEIFMKDKASRLVFVLLLLVFALILTIFSK